MSTVNPTSDILLVNRGANSYRCTPEEFKDNPGGKIQADDLFLVERSGTSYRVNYSEMSSPKLRADDLLLVNRGATSYHCRWDDFESSLGVGSIEGNITTNIPTSYSTTSGSANTFTFGITTSGSPTISYQWYWSGAAIPGATNESFSINPFYTNDTGKNLQCRVVLSKAGFDDISLNSNTCGLTVTKSTAGGRFVTPSDSEPYQENTNYDNPQNWKRCNGDKESGDVNTGSWKRAFEMVSTDRKHASFRGFVRRNASHQRNHYKKRDHTKGRNNNDVCGDDRWESGRGWNGKATLAWYAQTKPGNEYPQNMPGGASYNDGPRQTWERGRVSNGQDNDEKALHIDLNPDDWKYLDLDRYSNMEWFCNLQDVATGNSNENAKEYEFGCATNQEQRWFYTWKDRPQGGSPQRLNGACGQSDDYNWGKAKLNDSDRVGYRGLPYDYAYQERSGLPPANFRFFNDDRWYNSNLTVEENISHELDANKNGLLVTFQSNQFFFNGKPINEVEFRVGQKYTFFFPNRFQATLRLNDDENESDTLEGSMGTMIGFTPRSTGTHQLRLQEGVHRKIMNINILEPIVRDLTHIAYECGGHYPLYDTPTAAQEASPINAAQEYQLEDYTHWMPAGLELGVTMFLGDYTGGVEDMGIYEDTSDLDETK